MTQVDSELQRWYVDKRNDYSGGIIREAERADFRGHVLNDFSTSQSKYRQMYEALKLKMLKICVMR